MNRELLKGKWHQVKGSVRERWGELTDDDVEQIDGEWERLVGAIQEAYGLAKDDAERQIDEWSRSVLATTP